MSSPETSNTATFLTGVRKKTPVKSLTDTAYHAIKSGKVPFVPSHIGLPTTKIVDKVLNKKRQPKNVIPQKMKVALSTARKTIKYKTSEPDRTKYKPVQKKEYKPIKDLEQPGREMYIFNMRNKVLKEIFQKRRDAKKGVQRDFVVGKMYTRA